MSTPGLFKKPNSIKLKQKKERMAAIDHTICLLKKRLSPLKEYIVARPADINKTDAKKKNQSILDM